MASVRKAVQQAIKGAQSIIRTHSLVIIYTSEVRYLLVLWFSSSIRGWQLCSSVQPCAVNNNYIMFNLESLKSFLPALHHFLLITPILEFRCQLQDSLARSQ